MENCECQSSTTKAIEISFVGSDGKTEIVKIGERQKNWFQDDVYSRPLSVEQWRNVLARDMRKMPYMRRVFDQYVCELDAAAFEKATDKSLLQCCKRGTPEFYANMLWGTRRARERWIEECDSATGPTTQALPAGFEDDNVRMQSSLPKWEVIGEEPMEIDGELVEPELPLAQTGEQVLEASSSISGNANITFVDERPVDQPLTRLTGDQSIQDKHHDMSDTPWTSNAVLTREMIVGNFTWKAGGTGELAVYAFPRDFIVDGSTMKSQLSLCAFLRSDVEVRVVLNGNKFMIGRLIAHVEPIMSFADVTLNVDLNNPCFPHVFLDASVSNSAVLRIPFSHFLTYIPMAAGSLEDESACAIGRLYITVYNILQCPEGASQALHGTVYARFVNPEIHQTCFTIPEFSFGDGLVLGDIEPTAQAGEGEIEVVNRSVYQPCHGERSNQGCRLSLVKEGPVRGDAQTLEGDDFGLMKALQVPCLYGIASWKDSYAQGDLVYKFPVTPTFVQNGIYVPSKGYTYVPSYLNYISRCFAYYSGDLMCKIQVVGNAFSSGRLMHVYDPTWTPADSEPTTVQQHMNYNCVIQDIQEQQEIILRIPYMSIQPFLRCDHWTVVSNYGDETKPGKLGQHFMGSFHTVVLNSLVMPSGMTSHIDVNYFLYAADNFKLMVPISLNPLQLEPIPDKQTKRIPDYPVYVDSKIPLNFPYRHFIRETYLEGKRLYRLGMLSWAAKWWQSEPIEGVGSREEVYRYWYRSQFLYNFTSDVKSQQYQLMLSMGALGVKPLSSTVAEEEMPVTQGLEDYTSVRESGPTPIVMTKGNRKNEAPEIEPNALSKMMYRYYPLIVSPSIECVSAFTSFHIPVRPTFTYNLDKSVYGFDTIPEIHQIAWISSMYGFWSGSLKYKLMYSKTDAEVFVCYVPHECLPYSQQDGVSTEEVHRMLCYASNAAVSHLQGSIEVVVPFSSPYNQIMVDRTDYHHDLRFQNGTLIIYFRNLLSETARPGTTFTLFVGAGDDFKLNWLLPPPKVYDSRVEFEANSEDTRSMEFTEPHRSYSSASRNLETPNWSGFTEFESQMWFYHKDQVAAPTPLATITEAEETPVTQGLSDYIFRDLNVAARSLPQQIDDFNKSIREAKESLESFSGRAGDAHDKAAQYMDLAASTLLTGNCVKCFINAAHKPDFGNLMNLSISVATMLGYNIRRTIVDSVQQILSHFSQEKEQPQAQAIDGAIVDFVDNNENVITKCFAVLGTVIYAYVFDCMPDFGKLKGLIKSFLEEEPVAQGFDLRGAHFGYLGATALCKVFDNLVYYVRQFIDWALEKDSPESLLARKAMEIKDRVLKLIRDLDELDNEVEVIRAMQDPLVHNKFYVLANEANDLTDQFLLGNMDVRVGTLLTECRTRAKALIKRLERESPAHGWRYDPFVICLHGPTGTGKTAIMREISNHIANEMKLSIYNRTYNKTINDEYWSGYTGQPIVHWDEFGQNAQKDAMVGEFIELRGNDPHRLNMAALEDKGRYFSSRAIIMTTNVPYHEFRTVIRDRDAFFRRRHMLIGMRHRNGATVHQLQNNDRFDEDYSHCEFSIDDPMHANQRGRIMIKEEIFDAISEKVRTWNRKQMAMYDEYMLERGLGSLPRGVVPILRSVTEEELQTAQDVASGNVVELPESSAPLPDYDITPRRKQDMCMVMGDSDDIDILRRLNVLKPCIDGKGGTTYYLGVSSMEGMSELNAHYINNVAGCYVRVYNPRAAEKGLVEWGKEKLNSLYNRAKYLFESLKEKVINIYHRYPKLTIVGAALGSLTAVVGAYALINSAQKEGEGEDGLPTTIPWVQPEQAYDVHQAKIPKQLVKAENQQYDNTQNKLPKQLVKAEGEQPIKAVIAAPDVPTAEGNEDQCSTEIRKVVHPNLIVIGWEANSVKRSILRGLHIGGQLLLTPHHFFSGAREGERFVLAHRHHPIYIEYNKDQLIRLEDKDWCVYDCGPRFEPRRSLVKYFIDEKHLGKLTAVRTILANVTTDGTQVIQKGMARSVLNYKYKDATDGAHYIQQGWETNYATEAGDCGAFLMALTNAIPAPGKILGIHTAGYVSRSVGFSVLITRQMLERAVNKLPAQVMGLPVPPEVDRDEKVAQCLRIVPEGDYSIYGTMPNKLAPAQPLKSSFEMTSFAEEIKATIPNLKKPAHLKPFIPEHAKQIMQGDDIMSSRISPLRLALKKYGKSTKPFPARNIKKARKFVTNMFRNVFKDSARREYSEQEAILGVPGLEFADRLNMKSSPGWPYQVIDKKENGKHYLFDDDGNIVKEELKKRLHERMAAARRGERVPSIWRDCMKDELRPKEKVEQGKTRLFTIAPVDYTIFVRQLFMDFAISFYGNSCNFFSAVGINPESYEWTKLYNYLARCGKKCVAGDYSTFDGTLMPELMMAAVDIINDWYDDSEENKLARKVAVNEMIHTMQLVENCVYATHQGNPSGNPLTVIINTIVNYLYLLLVFYEIYPDGTAEEFSQFISVICYGDDVLITVMDKFERFNFNNIKNVLEAHGIGFTTDQKITDNAPDFIDLDDATFLKRGFRVDPEFGNQFKLPTMTTDTLYSYFHWVRKSEEPEIQFQENMRSSLTFAAFHGREFYEKYHKLWEDCMRSVNMDPLCITYEEQVDQFLISANAAINTGADRQFFDNLIEIEEQQLPLVENKNHMWKHAWDFVKGVGLGVGFFALYKIWAFGDRHNRALQAALKKETTDDRWAICIPSGEGKTTLAKKHPEYFVDIDDLIMFKGEYPGLKAYQDQKIREKFGVGREDVKNLTFFQQCSLVQEMQVWFLEWIKQQDHVKEDRRVLLTHSAISTRRRVAGNFLLPEPTGIRNNNVGRQIMKTIGNVQYVSFEQREQLCVEIVKEKEPEVFRQTAPIVQIQRTVGHFTSNVNY